jgi:predicted nucleic acid-binding protein
LRTGLARNDLSAQYERAFPAGERLRCRLGKAGCEQSDELSVVSYRMVRTPIRSCAKPASEQGVPRLILLRNVLPEVVSFDEQAARRAGEVRLFLESMRPNAQPIGQYDVLLAGHAIALGATLVTHNTREFTRVPGLAIEDWQSA